MKRAEVSEHEEFDVDAFLAAIPQLPQCPRCLTDVTFGKKVALKGGSQKNIVCKGGHSKNYP